MSLCLFNLFESVNLLAHGAGMVLGNGVALASSGTKQPYEVGPLHLPVKRLSRQGATPQKPLRADGPVTQIARLDPRRVTARRWCRPGESRPPAVVGSSAKPHRP